MGVHGKIQIMNWLKAHEIPFVWRVCFVNQGISRFWRWAVNWPFPIYGPWMIQQFLIESHEVVNKAFNKNTIPLQLRSCRSWQSTTSPVTPRTRCWSGHFIYMLGSGRSSQLENPRGVIHMGFSERRFCRIPTCPCGLKSDYWACLYLQLNWGSRWRCGLCAKPCIFIAEPFYDRKKYICRYSFLQIYIRHLQHLQARQFWLQSFCF